MSCMKTGGVLPRLLITDIKPRSWLWVVFGNIWWTSLDLHVTTRRTIFCVMASGVFGADYMDRASPAIGYNYMSTKLAGLKIGRLAREFCAKI